MIQPAVPRRAATAVLDERGQRLLDDGVRAVGDQCRHLELLGLRIAPRGIERGLRLRQLIRRRVDLVTSRGLGRRGLVDELASRGDGISRAGRLVDEAREHVLGGLGLGVVGGEPRLGAGLSRGRGVDVTLAVRDERRAQVRQDRLRLMPHPVGEVLRVLAQARQLAERIGARDRRREPAVDVRAPDVRRPGGGRAPGGASIWRQTSAASSASLPCPRPRRGRPRSPRSRRGPRSAD